MATIPKVIPIPRERLTRGRVVDAALQVMDEEGLDALSMRRLAREVGVEAMSLYHYVRDKDDLLDALCARVMSDFDIPEGEGGSWDERARVGAREWRRVLKAHPNVIRLFAERSKPMTDLDALRPMEYALGLIMETSIDERAAVQVFNVMGGFIMGFVMMEVGQMFSAGALNADAPAPEEILRTFPSTEFPAIAAAMPHLASCDPDEQFELGLDLLLSGLRSRSQAGGR